MIHGTSRAFGCAGPFPVPPITSATVEALLSTGLVMSLIAKRAVNACRPWAKYRSTSGNVLAFDITPECQSRAMDSRGMDAHMHAGFMRGGVLVPRIPAAGFADNPICGRKPRGLNTRFLWRGVACSSRRMPAITPRKLCTCRSSRQVLRSLRAAERAAGGRVGSIPQPADSPPSSQFRGSISWYIHHGNLYISGNFLPVSTLHDRERHAPPRKALRASQTMTFGNPLPSDHSIASGFQLSGTLHA